MLIMYPIKNARLSYQSAIMQAIAQYDMVSINLRPSSCKKSHAIRALPPNLSIILISKNTFLHTACMILKKVECIFFNTRKIN